MKKISRAKAIERGLNKYYTGKPCPHSHVSERYVCKSACVECVSVYNLNRRLLDPEKHRKRYNDYARNHRHNGTIHKMNKGEGAIALSTPKPEVCPICNIIPEEWNLDHDHSTGKFRGWLCRWCNCGLGNMKDNISNLENAIKYLKGEN
jgi:rubrerythrin